MKRFKLLYLAALLLPGLALAADWPAYPFVHANATASIFDGRRRTGRSGERDGADCETEFHDRAPRVGHGIDQLGGRRQLTLL